MQIADRLDYFGESFNAPEIDRSWQKHELTEVCCYIITVISLQLQIATWYDVPFVISWPPINQQLFALVMR